jgi:outer membrane protein assembly complex protein YaeT
MTATDRRCRLRWTAVLGGLLLCIAAAFGQTPVAPVPRKVQVEDVRLQGNVQIPTHRIMPHIKTRAGQDYSEDAIQEDIKNLYATKLFANVQAAKQFTKEGNVIVFFSVVETPSKIERIEYKGGGHLKIKDLEEITNLKRGQPMNPIINRRACQEIVRRFNEDGRPLAICELLKGDRPGDTEVIFQITEGPKVKIKAIEFRGNETFVSSAVLRNHVDSSAAFLGVIGGKFHAAMADHDAIKLEEYYRSYGFVDCHVSREVELSPDGSYATLVFHIHEGQRYTVQGTQIIGNIKAFSLPELERIPRVKSGEYIDENKIKRDENAIKDYYGWRGMSPLVRAELYYPEDTPGVARVVYQIPQEQPPKRVGEPIIVGNTVTRQNVILREVPLYPGQVLTYPEIRRAEANLARLGIFEVNQEGVRPHIEIQDVEGSDFANPIIYVQEAKTGSLVFGLGVNSDAGLQGTIRFNERNFDISNIPTSWDDFLSGRAFRGAGQELTIEAVPGTELQRYSFTFREPRLFDSLYSLSVSGYYFDRIYNEDNESRLGTRIGIGRRLNDKWSVNASLRVENVGIHNVSPAAPVDYQSVVGNNFLVGFKGAVARDTRDSYLRPTEGGRLELAFEEVTGDFTFPVASLEGNRYFTLHQRADGSGRQVLALRSMVGYSGSHTPVFERFYAGGFRSLRGFEFRGVGPDSLTGFKLGGDFIFLNSIEYQYPIKANDQIYLVAFVDSGTVERTVEIRDYRVSAGFGIRFVVPMLGPVPIALDFGFPIVKGPGDNQQVFSFWLGWNF